MLYSILFAAVPKTGEWTPTIGIIMSLSCLFAVAIGRFAIQHAGEGGPRLPLKLPAIWDKFGTPELLATMSFGHIIGAGIILGLRNTGVI
ncbi:MAG: photosystem I reaction center subunit PsaK [Leptolyngbyaceae cyanobacterium bins.59]|nr:photosystem I reaction center subunit PsaK [Leptolyngbyaceae cyanobacterium bins.59]